MDGARPHHGRTAPGVLAVVALGGMVGASARYGVARWVPARPAGFPWATFWINLAGSFLLGFLLVLLLERFPPTRLVRPFLATGVLGAFTTMSTYQMEILLLARSGFFAIAVAYATASLLAGLLLAYLGVRAGRLATIRHRKARP